MSDFIVTARKWRPLLFEDVAAQDHVTTTLRNAIATKRIAHAYLFSGPRGVGKTTTARILAKAVNCLHPVDNNPDNECNNCREITEGRSFDVLEIDGASNRGIEEMRNLREAVRYAPAQGSYKIYIIDEVHMLTKEAFNALLKTLEEPPPHVLFIFATTEVHKVPATILSRCQRFEFRRIAIEEITGNLKSIAAKEKVTIDDDSLLLLAKKADGSMRDAQSLFDQAVALCGKSVTHKKLLDALNIVDVEIFFRVTDMVKAKDAAAGLKLVEELVSNGHDLREFLHGLIEHLRNILIAKTAKSTQLIEASENYKNRYGKEAEAFSIGDILRLLRHVQVTEDALRWSSQPRYRLEGDIVHMITTHTAPEVGELLQQIEALKKKLDEPGTLKSSTPSSLAKPVPAPVGETSATVPKPATVAKEPEGPVSKANLAQPPTPVIQPQPSKLIEGEVSSRWPEFVAEVRRQRISLGSVLESATLLGVSGSTIRVGCANDFQASSINRNKELILSIVQRLFSAKARIEVEITSNPQTLQPMAGKPESLAATVSEEHPVIQAMIRELGAEPMG